MWTDVCATLTLPYLGMLLQAKASVAQTLLSVLLMLGSAAKISNQPRYGTGQMPCSICQAKEIAIRAVKAA
jgi:hypothetical protein